MLRQVECNPLEAGRCDRYPSFRIKVRSSSAVRCLKQESLPKTQTACNVSQELSYVGEGFCTVLVDGAVHVYKQKQPDRSSCMAKKAVREALEMWL